MSRHVMIWKGHSRPTGSRAGSSVSTKQRRQISTELEQLLRIPIEQRSLTQRIRIGQLRQLLLVF